jgi:hypothetical protein
VIAHTKHAVTHRSHDTSSSLRESLAAPLAKTANLYILFTAHRDNGDAREGTPAAEHSLQSASLFTQLISDPFCSLCADNSTRTYFKK